MLAANDLDWLWVQPNGGKVLVNLAAVDAARLVPATGGSPPGVDSESRSFVPRRKRPAT